MITPRKQGFTLIELLIVVGIVALLTAILLPVFLATRERAKTAACASNLHQLYLAVAQYAGDNGGLLPPDDGQQLIDTLHPYTRSAALWHCPSDTTPEIMSYNYLPYALRNNSGATRFTGIDSTEPRFGSSNIGLLEDSIGCKEDAAYSHGGRYNEVFFDGHVKGLDPCSSSK